MDSDNFDETYYLAANPDVDFAVSKGHFKSGKEHYLKFGHKENRKIYPPKITDELGGGIYSSHNFAYPYSSVGKLKPVTSGEKSLSLPKDLELIKKIANAFSLANKNQPDDFRVDKSGMWSYLLTRFDWELIPYLKQNELEKAGNLLGMIFDTYLTRGLGMSKVNNYIAKKFQMHFASVWADRLIRLSEALGLIKIRSFEQIRGSYTEPLNPNIDMLIEKICEKIIENSMLIRPNIGCCHGIKLGSTIWYHKDFEHILAAKTIADLALGNKTLAIMEIGGGFGGLAYWLYKIGFRDITVYDVPQMNIIQEYYLSKTLPEAKICFYDDNDKSLFESSEIKILPYWHLDKIPSKLYDISVNQDSLPEIPIPIAKDFLKKIIHTTKKYFYSVNQEAQAPNFQSGVQEPVYKLVKDIDGFKLLIRSPFWCRPGYVQEIYILN